jgi:hypothetical protein
VEERLPAQLEEPLPVLVVEQPQVLLLVAALLLVQVQLPAPEILKIWMI